MNRKTFLLSLPVFLILFIAVAVFALFIGPSDYTIADVLRGIFGDSSDTTLAAIIKLRAFRIVAAMLVGVALSASGVVSQSVLRNPLADPYILGISGGAGLATVIFVFFFGGIIAGAGYAAIAIAIIGALSAVFIIILVESRFPQIGLEGLILLGVMLNAFCGSMIIAFASFMGETSLMSFFRWLLGSFSIIPYDSGLLVPVGLLILGLCAILMLEAKKLNLLLLSKDESESLGINVRRVRRILLVISGILAALAVSLAGLVGFVGLVVPHIARKIVGGDARVLLPVSAILGASILILCDCAARTMLEPSELPVGVITSLLGAPLFVLILISRNKSAKGMG